MEKLNESKPSLEQPEWIKTLLRICEEIKTGKQESDASTN